MAKKNIPASVRLGDLYNGDQDKIIGYLDAQIEKYETDVRIKNWTRLKNILGTVISGSLVIIICIYLHLAHKDSNADRVFILSVVMIAFIIICCAFLSRLTEVVSAITICVILGGLFLFLGRGDFSFEAMSIWWQKFSSENTKDIKASSEQNIINLLNQ
ncbi:MAG: hypothetical protein E2590_09175 [Chryseobacterium sp.]|nr:hypothetical protein [Chryseobacterium sp.]